MITINNQSINVKTGLAKGSISVGVKANRMIIQQLASPKVIGSVLQQEDIKELLKITIDFSKVESVDAFIKVLESIKSNMTGPKYYLAC